MTDSWTYDPAGNRLRHNADSVTPPPQPLDRSRNDDEPSPRLRFSTIVTWRHDKGPQCSVMMLYSTSQDGKNGGMGRHGERKKKQQEFQCECEPITVTVIRSQLMATGTTLVVVVVVKCCRVQADVRQQGARGAVPVSVSAPP